APDPGRWLRLGKALERGAGEIDEIRRHQRQHAGREEAHQTGDQRGEDRDVGSHGTYMRCRRRPAQVEPRAFARMCSAGERAGSPATRWPWPTGRRGPMPNLIPDVAGVLVGNADDARLASGVTAIVFEEPAVAGVDVRGGAPGTRETDLLEPHRTIERI